MTEIITGMTVSQFITAINGNFPSKTAISSTDLTDVLISKHNANYDYVRNIDSDIPDRTAIVIGMNGADYIAALNQNFNKVNNEASYREYDYTIPNNRGSEYGMLLDIYYDPGIIRLSSGDDLIGGISRGGAMSRENFCIVGKNGLYSNPLLMGFDESTEGTYDTHGKAVFVEKDGIIYAFHEALDGVSDTNQNGHNSDIVCKKSEDNGVSWVEITRIDGRFCYPKIFIIDGNFYLITREVIENSYKHIALFKSTDNCANWDRMTDPYIGVDPYWAYNSIPKNAGGEIHILITERKTIDIYTAWPTIFHLRSTDGVTYYNSTKTWSKNVVSNGSVTRAEALANCKISTNTIDDYSAILNGSFVKNDKLYTCISYGQPSLSVTPFGEITKVDFDSCKIYENFTEILDISSLISGASYTGYSQDQFMRFLRNGDTFDILLIDIKNNNDVLLLNYSAGILVSTKLLKTAIADVTNLFLGGSTFNSTTRDGRIFVMGNLTGTMIDLVNSYSDMIIFENN